MDPTFNLQEQLIAAREIIDAGQPDEDWSPDSTYELAAKSRELAELVLALDEWIVKGGFLPARWQRKGKS